MFILIKNQEGESMNLLSQNTDFNALLAAMKTTDDIKFILEESGCYESEIEMMKAGGTYDAFVKRVYDAIDWSHLSERIAQMENEAITAAIDKLSDSMI